MNVVKEYEKGIWVPLEILRNDELSPNEKFVLGGIENILRDGKECFIANSKLARTLAISEKRVASILTSLVKKDFIEVRISYEETTGICKNREILLMEKFKKNLRADVLDFQEEDCKESSKIDPLIFEQVEEESNKIAHLISEGVVEKVHENDPLKNEPPIDNNIYNNLSLKDRLEDRLLNTRSLKEEKIEKTSKSNSNVFINTREEVEKPSQIRLDIFGILGKPQYERLEKYTRRNILKYCSHIPEDVFANSFEKISKLEELGLIKEFDAAFYLDIQGKWKNYEIPAKALKETPVIEKEDLDDKIRWFKNCFRGVRVDEYEEYLSRIPFYLLEENRKKLGRLNPYEFKQEIKKLMETPR